jgi:hypothetical protein
MDVNNTENWKTTTLLLNPTGREFLFISRPDMKSAPYLCYFKGHHIGARRPAEWLECTSEEFHELLGIPSERTEMTMAEVWDRLFTEHSK